MLHHRSDKAPYISTFLEIILMLLYPKVALTSPSPPPRP